MRDAVLRAPELAEENFGLAVACNVTKPEHRRLTTTKDGFGWARYIAAVLVVIDITTGDLADLDAMARAQLETVERLWTCGLTT